MPTARTENEWQGSAVLRNSRSHLDSARDAADRLASLFAGRVNERLLVAHLDDDRRLLNISTFEGGIGEIALPIRGIAAAALAADGRGLILAHNHPSGDPTPSFADRAATRLLSEAMAPLDIRIHDHLVFGGGACRSFRALGWL